MSWRLVPLDPFMASSPFDPMTTPMYLASLDGPSLGLYHGLFALFASLAWVSAAAVVASVNPIHGVLYLVLVFCNASALLVVAGFEFLALVFLVVYVGAIAVLFLFVVMMLHVHQDAWANQAKQHLPLGLLVLAAFLGELAILLDWSPLGALGGAVGPEALEGHGPQAPGRGSLDPLAAGSVGAGRGAWAPLADGSAASAMAGAAAYVAYPDALSGASPMQAVGLILYTFYVYIFMVAAFILLVAMVGAIRLTLHHRPGVRRQSVFAQNHRDVAEALKVAARPGALA